MLYFRFGGRWPVGWGWTIAPGGNEGTAFYMAIVPVASQVGISFLLPFGLGLN
jgi:hypothetical protein